MNMCSKSPLNALCIEMSSPCSRGLIRSINLRSAGHRNTPWSAAGRRSTTAFAVSVTTHQLGAPTTGGRVSAESAIALSSDRLSGTHTIVVRPAWVVGSNGANSSDLADGREQENSIPRLTRSH
jgi:hypothetical protein